MAWFKVDDGFHDHPKVDNLSLEAIGLWIMCATWSSRHLTDGVVPFARIVKLGGNAELCSELVRANMWRTSEDVRDAGSPNTYEYVNWGDWNPTKDDVQEDRKKARERMKNLRSKQSDQGKRSGEQTANERRTSGDVRDPVPSRPVPYIETTSSPAPKGRKRPATRLPDDWMPSQDHCDKATQLGLDIDEQVERFRNHAAANDRRQASWNASFSNWLLQSSKYQNESNRQTGDPNAHLWR